ncbi:MAG TPA: DUF4169 family protein [Roseococcus sp.]|nr:DUF4169 family protein [Roseococcus sp.]
MSAPVNLRQARKARDKAAREAAAAVNRAAHGRTRAERERDAAAEALRRRLLDGAKRED